MFTFAPSAIYLILGITAFFIRMFSMKQSYVCINHVFMYVFMVSCNCVTEQPSSSSISTTTSSVTSMTSLEHESADTSASVSDYGPDNWDQENWGDMDVS